MSFWSPVHSLRPTLRCSLLFEHTPPPMSLNVESVRNIFFCFLLHLKLIDRNKTLFVCGQRITCFVKMKQDIDSFQNESSAKSFTIQIFFDQNTKNWRCASCPISRFEPFSFLKSFLPPLLKTNSDWFESVTCERVLSRFQFGTELIRANWCHTEFALLNLYKFYQIFSQTNFTPCFDVRDKASTPLSLLN